MAALAVNAVSWRSYGHSLILFFLAIFCLQSITSHYFLSLFGNIWVYAFLIESLLPVLVSHHQYTVLETIKRVRFSALAFQSCTKILKGWEWAWKWNTALRCAVLSVHSYHGMYGPKAELFFLFELWLLMGQTCTVTVRTQTGRIHPLLSFLLVSPPLLPCKMGREEDSGPAEGSTSWLSVTRSLLFLLHVIDRLHTCSFGVFMVGPGELLFQVLHPA